MFDGILITALIQSCRLDGNVVSFVNAGLMTLGNRWQSYGANVGRQYGVAHLLLDSVDITIFALRCRFGSSLLFRIKVLVNRGAVIIGFSFLVMGLSYITTRFPLWGNPRCFEFCLLTRSMGSFLFWDFVLWGISR